MPSLLDLPRELVQQIILYTLQPPFNRPTSPECIKLGDRVTSGKRRRFQDPIMYYYRKNPIHSLTLTYRQMHMDTADVWKREGDKLDCKIDVMITEDDDFLVTWLMYPKRMVDMPNGGWKVEKVDIGLRFFQGQLERSQPTFEYAKMLHTLVMDLKSHGPVPREPTATKYSKRGRRTLREAAKNPRKPNVFEALFIEFLGAAVLKPGRVSMYRLRMIIEWFIGMDQLFAVPWGEFEGGMYEDRIDVYGHRGCGLRKLEFWSQRFLVLEYELQLYETVKRTWITTKAYAPPSTVPR